MVVDVVRSRAAELYPNVVTPTFHRIMEAVFDKYDKQFSLPLQTMDARELKMFIWGLPYWRMGAEWILLCIQTTMHDLDEGWMEVEQERMDGLMGTSGDVEGGA